MLPLSPYRLHSSGNSTSIFTTRSPFRPNAGLHQIPDFASPGDGVDIVKNINLVNPRGVHIVRRVQLLAQADNFLCRNPGQQQPQPVVQVPGPTQDNFLNAVLAEELIVRVINPGNCLRLQGAVKHLVQNENDLLSGRVLGQKFKDCGHSGGILALGNVGNQLDIIIGL